MENIMNDHKFTGRPSSERMTLGERWARFKRRAPLYRRALREWGRIHGRRITHQFHNVVAGNRAAGPVTFLACSGALAVALTMTTLYTPAYSVTLDGESVGVVADAEVVQQAMETVEATGTSLLGHDYQIEGNLEYEFALTLRSDLTSEEDIQNYFYGKLDSVSGELRQYQVVVDGQAVGAVKDEDGLDRLLEELKAKYTSENTVSVEFMDTVTIEPVYEAENLMTLSEMRTALQANQGGSTTYTVVAGDTFYGIAYANDMSMSDLEALNPGIDINRLMVGDVLNVKELTPILSVQTVLNAQVDAASGKAVKFLASSAVPIVGGAFGDAVAAIQNSVEIVKSGVGAFGILAALCIFVPAMLQGALWMGVCLLGQVAAGLFDTPRLGSLFGACAWVAKMVLAVLVSVCAVAVVCAALVLCVKGSL